MKLTARQVQKTIAAGVLATLLGAIFSGGVRAQQETPPPPSAPRPFNLPRPVEKTLPNGLRVLVVERTVAKGGMPLVFGQLLIKSGGEIDPPQLSGLASMTASLLTEGTTSRTATQIAEEIEALGGSLESGARWDASTASVGVMSNKIEPAMNIMADVVRRPVFKDEEIERQRQQTLDHIRVAMKEPGALAGLVAARTVFGGSAYGHPLGGTLESVARIKRDDIVNLHRAYYRPDNAVLVMGGDLTAGRAFELAEKFFGDWQRPPSPLPAPKPDASANAGAQPHVLVVDKSDAGQAAVILAVPALRRADPQYFRGIVSNSVLGGGYSARLNQEIRIKRGLSYGASSSLDARRDAGAFSAASQTQNQSAAEVASLMITELTRLSSEPVAPAELTPRKATLIGNFGRSLETDAGLTGRVAALALYGLSLDEINRYVGEVQSVTAADIQKFAGSRLSPAAASIIIVGDAKQFLVPLRKQFPNVEVIPESQLDLNNVSLRRSSAG